jgi:hypothetical chaperone protein
MRLGIDFGTTNSAAAVYDGSQLTPVTVGAEHSKILPSLIYIDREHQATLGWAAAREYARRETGRPVRWKSRSIGMIEIVVAGKGGSPITYQQEVFVTYDDAANGRLLQSVKTALRNERYHGTQIFDRFYTLDELIALLLTYFKESAETQLGQRFDDVLIGRPVKFHDHPRLSFRAEEIIYKAARRVGFKDVSFQTEPTGAMYLYHTSSKQRRKVIVFDFGGGTLDLTVAEVGGKNKPNILSTRGLLVGGDDLDRRIFQSLYPYFGEDPANGESMPYDVVDSLHNWQTMPELSRPQYLELFDTLRRNHPYPEKINALQTLVSKNVGFSLFREVERVKRELTTNDSSELHFVYNDINIQEQITRHKFEAWIRPELREVENGIQQVIADAGLQPRDIEVVLRTGGSSLVPAFVELLTGIFSAGKLSEMDPLISVVGGLGIIAHQDGGLRGAYCDKYLNSVPPIEIHSNTKLHTYTVGVGIRCYTDLDTLIRKLPVELSGLLGVKTAHADREATTDTFITLTVDRPTRIYIAYSSAALEHPLWLRDFEREDMTIEVTDEWWGIKELQVYSKVFNPRQIILGGNHGAGWRGRVDIHYTVMIEGALTDVVFPVKSL